MSPEQYRRYLEQLAGDLRERGIPLILVDIPLLPLELGPHADDRVRPP